MQSEIPSLSAHNVILTALDYSKDCKARSYSLLIGFLTQFASDLVLSSPCDITIHVVLGS